MSLTRRQLLLAVASTPLLPVLGVAQVCPGPLGAIVDEAGYYFDPTRWPDLVNSGEPFIFIDAKPDAELLSDLRCHTAHLCTVRQGKNIFAALEAI